MPDEKTKVSITDIFIYAVVGLYAVSLIVGMFKPDYQMPASIQAIMGAAATYLFADRVLKRSKNGNSGKTDALDKDKQGSSSAVRDGDDGGVDRGGGK